MRFPPDATDAGGTAGTITTTATVGRRSRFAQLQPHLVSTLVRLEPGRPAYALGLRMAIIITVPLAVGVGLGQVGPTSIVALAAVNGGMADSGGAKITRWRAMTAATLFNALALAAGTLAGNHIGAAVPLVLVVTFACAMVNLYGNVASNVGFLVSILFILGVGQPGDGALSAQRLWLALIGGAWSVVVALLVWPVRPYAAAGDGVAGSFRSVAALARVVAERVRYRDRTDAIEVTTAAIAAREEIAAARSVLALTRSRRRGHSARGSVLLELLDGAGSLVEGTESMVTLGEMASRLPDSGGINAATARSLDGVAAAMVAMADAIEHPDAGLDWRPVDAIETQMAELDDLMGSIRRIQLYDAVATLRPMVEVQRHVVTTTALLASEWRATGEKPGTDGSDSAADVGARLAPRKEVRFGDWIRSAYQILVSNLTLQSAVLRHALRMGGTCAAGEALVLAVHLAKGYWVLVTIAVVLRPYAAITLQRTILRLAGTMLGAAIAAGILVAEDQSVGLILILFVLALLTFSLISLNYGLGVVFLTPLVIVLISTGQPGDWAVAGHRILNTLIGAGLALLGGYVLWPKVDRRELVDELATALEADRVHLGAVLDASVHPSDASDAAAVRSLHEKAGLAVANAQTAFQRLLGEPARNRRQSEALWSVTDAARRTFLATSSLEGHLGPRDDTSPRPRLDRAQRDADRALSELSEALRQHRAPDPSRVGKQDLADAVAEVSSAAADLRAGRRAELAVDANTLTPLAYRAREASLVAGVLELLEVLIGEVNDGVEALSPASVPA
ncbi:MAG TPA: FUSC family protein [Acidimicrobiales bacterium]|nr:FUSC family protein [Acidimicrobiales bacterium]